MLQFVLLSIFTMFRRLCFVIVCTCCFAGTASAARWPRAYMISPQKIQIDFTEPTNPDDAVDLTTYRIRKTDLGNVQVRFATLLNERTVELTIRPAQPICTKDRYVLSLRAFNPARRKFVSRELEFGSWCI